MAGGATAWTTMTDEYWVTGPPGWPARDYVEVLDSDAMRDKGYRVEMCRRNPLLFALLYFPHRMMIKGRVHLSQLHYDMARSARFWARKDIEPGEIREAWIAPRSSAKSTWLLGHNAIWALVYGHLDFIAMFGSKASGISDTHFANMKKEFEENELLRFDFPELCTPKRKPSAREYRANSGAIVVCRGLDESNLGLNIDGRRPDGLFIDDPEKDEGNFSTKVKDKRLDTFRQAVLGMNIRAVVQWAGTTTAYGCLAHDLVRDAVGETTADWVREVGMRTHYYPAIVADANGAETSLWEPQWPLAWLLKHRGQRDFELNYMNRPLGGSGTLWTQEHVLYGIPAGWDISRRIIRIDPAVTSKASSDYTGICVAGYASNVRKVAIELAQAVRCTPEKLLANVRQILEARPDIREIQVESNQGADYVAHALSGLPSHVRVSLSHSSQSKAVRFGIAFSHYEKGRVLHSRQFRLVEDQMFAFPNGAHDDGPDAVVGAVNSLLKDAVQLQKTS